MLSIIYIITERIFFFSNTVCVLSGCVRTTSRFPQVPFYLNQDRGELSKEQLRGTYILQYLLGYLCISRFPFGCITAKNKYL